MDEKKELTLEENFKELQETVSLLEREGITQEEAFQAYSKGMELLKVCNEQVDRVEKQVLKLQADGTTTPLKAEE